MNADVLFEYLRSLKEEGTDLSKLEVITKHTEYDPNIAYDRGLEVEHYPDDVDNNASELVIW